MALLLKHQTIEQFVSRFREAYRSSEQETCLILGEFIIAKVQAGEITDTMCQKAFGKTAGQWNAIKTKMNQRIAAKNTIKTAIGE